MGVWNISHGSLPPSPATGPSRAPHPRSINPCQGRWRARNGSFPDRKESILINSVSMYENVAQKTQTKDAAMRVERHEKRQVPAGARQVRTKKKKDRSSSSSSFCAHARKSQHPRTSSSSRA